LKAERQRLEAELARDTEEARLRQGPDGAGSDHVGDSVESLEVTGVNATRYKARVTPAGQIEDDGDFSDFYKLPDELDEFTRLEIQASQDEELARLLQEQEHKVLVAKRSHFIVLHKELRGTQRPRRNTQILDKYSPHMRNGLESSAFAGKVPNRYTRDVCISALIAFATSHFWFILSPKNCSVAFAPEMLLVRLVIVPLYHLKVYLKCNDTWDCHWRLTDKVDTVDNQFLFAAISIRHPNFFEQLWVTPAGQIEDDGDFSDFYKLPDELDEFTRLEIQASQDELLTNFSVVLFSLAGAGEIIARTRA
ncbi:uncharacterized protein LOC118478209, partial [Aplysia californica]|uniref:Uncharacterized protein LOC118478209 n=1 Tax=Aplysia californica TaxID=6500 RepID=A0ABM1VXT7_APLCA